MWFQHRTWEHPFLLLDIHNVLTAAFRRLVQIYKWHADVERYRRSRKLGWEVNQFCRTIVLKDKIFREFTHSEKMIQRGGWTVCRIITSCICNTNELRRNKGLRRRLSVLCHGLLRTKLIQKIEWHEHQRPNETSREGIAPVTSDNTAENFLWRM